jgi:ethanolamine ammonia-lyase large subunit
MICWLNPETGLLTSAPEKSMPDYLNDLNAMHKAIKKAILDERYPFFDHLLQNVMGGDWCYTSQATADQFAEAFAIAMDTK